MVAMTLAPIIQIISQKIKDKKKKAGSNEGFSENEVTVGADPRVSLVFTVIDLVLMFIALFMFFKRNPDFDLLPFLAALCCSPCYIAYALAVPIQPSDTPQMITGGRRR